MAKYGKWIGAGLGWTLGGPIGAIIGFGIGSMFDKSDSLVTTSQQRATTSGDFTVSLLVLIAAVMKADGKVMKSELNYVQQNFSRSYGAQNAKQLSILLRDILNQEINLSEVCYQIKSSMEYSARLQLLHFIYGLAQADGHIDQSELNIISQIAAYLNINSKDTESIKSMFVANTDNAYKILEIEKTATDSEVKKAYKKMAIKYHPDKVSHLGEDIRKAAEEKIKKVNEAYAQIKKERGIS